MRRIFFYLKMAGGNILRNRRFYLPYLLCCAGTAAMSYIVGYLCMDRMVDEMPGADYVRTFMWLGVYVMVFFSFFIIRFANSFIIKRRRRELGLYNILGLQKGNIAVLMAFETAILLLISLIFGLGIGILFSKLALLILAQVLSFGVPMGFSISGGGDRPHRRDAGGRRLPLLSRLQHLGRRQIQPGSSCSTPQTKGNGSRNPAGCWPSSASLCLGE